MELPPLYKFMDVRGAQLTLGRGTFRHAKPSDFNDLEDLTVQSIFSESTEAALTKISDELTGVLVEHMNETPTCSSPMKEQVEILLGAFRSNPDAARIVEEEMRKGADAAHDIERMRGVAKSLLGEINRQFQDYRVLCVTTRRDADRMWTEYADNHKGIALRVQPNLAKGSKFTLFRPVEYVAKRPPLYANTRQFIADSIFGDHEANVRTMTERIIYSKTLAWSHESEYRLAIPLGRGERPWDTLRYHPEEITELYLGADMAAESREEVVDLARRRNPKIAIAQAVRDQSQNGIVFRQLSQ